MSHTPRACPGLRPSRLDEACVLLVRRLGEEEEVVPVGSRRFERHSRCSRRVAGWLWGKVWGGGAVLGLCVPGTLVRGLCCCYRHRCAPPALIGIGIPRGRNMATNRPLWAALGRKSSPPSGQALLGAALRSLQCIWPGPGRPSSRPLPATGSRILD